MRNLRGLNGFFFGKLGEDYILKPENMDGHILVVGGSGSGKSSCIVIPSLMTWRERVFTMEEPHNADNQPVFAAFQATPRHE